MCANISILPATDKKVDQRIILYALLCRAEITATPTEYVLQSALIIITLHSNVGSWNHKRKFVKFLVDL